MPQSPATPLPSPKERRRLREAKSLSQAEVAARIGVTRATVRSWETGRTTPRGRKREAYARLLNAEAPAPTTRRATKPRTPEPTTPPALPEPHPHAQPQPQPRPHPHPHPQSVRVATVEPPEPPQERDLTPAQAFDALCAYCAPGLVRQTYLLTGRRVLAQESVERAFQLAWQRWPEVAVDRDPAGWVRAAAYEYAMSPWHRFRPGQRHPDALPASPADLTFVDVLLSLPPAQRRALMLYDGLGLDLPETAAETEASTPATANRLLHAREAVAEQMPELADLDVLHRRLREVGGAETLRLPKSERIRTGSEYRARFWTRAAIAFTALIVGATALTLKTAPTRYEPPQAPGTAISGVPPRMGPGPLSYEDTTLREKLRAELTTGHPRLTPHLP
ncbi:sigma factor-like helix-turn-helix DNA-binding protein [Streptomyces sp. NPDC093510]|uniref:sigma factor-like helix-turn-helix DNA-binding protein n=1 Tax=Streptomyces sp. NPDC093510 TaxID=3155199 RepID=UPI003444373B